MIPDLKCLRTRVDGKSDEELSHLWAIADSRWASVFDARSVELNGRMTIVSPWTWVRAFRHDRPRGPSDGLFCYMAERNIAPRFTPGSEERLIVMFEYDGVARLIEHRDLRKNRTWRLDPWIGLIRERVTEAA